MPNCAQVLIPDTLLTSSSQLVNIAQLDSIDSTQYDSLKHGAGADATLPISGIPVKFGASYDDFRNDLETFKRNSGYTLDQAQSLFIVQQKVGKEKVDAWLKCKLDEGGQGGIALAFQPQFQVDMDDDPQIPSLTVPLDISYVKPQLFDPGDVQVSLTTAGGILQTLTGGGDDPGNQGSPRDDTSAHFLTFKEGGKQTVLVSRNGRASSVTVTANAVAQQGATWSDTAGCPWQLPSLDYYPFQVDPQVVVIKADGQRDGPHNLDRINAAVYGGGTTPISFPSDAIALQPGDQLEWYFDLLVIGGLGELARFNATVPWTIGQAYRVAQVAGFTVRAYPASLTGPVCRIELSR